METCLLRAATAADLAAINAIYNHYVVSSTCTYQLEPSTAAERAAWFAAHGPEHPVIVAEADGEVVGWGSLSTFHTRAAFRRTVEDSVYIRHDRQRRGIGGALLAELVVRARALGHHTIIAAIDGEQAGSVVLHEKHGFTPAGRLRAVGNKFGRWLDLVYMERLL
ncbi:N-acetyltransferase [Verrucomicrobiota bacterium]|nr:N-acetyltransferase [Verrucomicrobiota bacterium]